MCSCINMPKSTQQTKRERPCGKRQAIFNGWKNNLFQHPGISEYGFDKLGHVTPYVTAPNVTFLIDDGFKTCK